MQENLFEAVVAGRAGIAETDAGYGLDGVSSIWRRRSAQSYWLSQYQALAIPA
jgi:hypothetical protein